MRRLSREQAAVPSASTRETWTVALLLCGLTLLALLVRWAFLNARSVWFDEAFSVYIASAGPAGIVQKVSRSDFHPPLYYFVLNLWLGFGRSPAAIRSLSAVCGALTVVLTWLLAAGIGGRVLAAMSALLLAASALAIQASVEARMYALLGLVSAAATWFLAVATRGNAGGKAWVAYAVALAATLYIHYVAVFLLLGHLLYVLFWHRSERALRLRMLGAVAAALLAYLPWWPIAAEQLSRLSGEWTEKTSVATLLNIGAAAGFGGYVLGLAGYLTVPGGWSWPQVALVAPFLSLALIGGLSARGGSLTRLLLLCWVVPVLGLVTVSLAMGSAPVRPRYLSFLQPLFVILMANGILSVASWFPKRWPAILTMTAAIVLLNLSVVQRSFGDRRVQPFDWAGAARYVVAQRRQGDGFVFYPHYARIAFGYYVSGVGMNAITLYQLSARTNVSRQDMLRALAPMAKSLHGANRVWVVMTVPSAVEARETILQAVEQSYDRKEFADFRYVWVILYEKSSS